MLLYPLNKIFITQHFGERPLVYKPYKGHAGVDFRTKFDDTPDGKRVVTASADGIIQETGDQGTKGYGKFIRIKHFDDSESVYGHLTTWYVTKGTKVSGGEKIGLSGNTGFSSAPHLHFGFRPKNYNYNNGFAGYIDPLPFFEKNTTQQLNAIYSTPYSLLKKRGESAIYLYGHDNLWHGLQDMNILKTLIGTYNKTNVQIVEKLPSNLGEIIYSTKNLP